MSEAGRAEEGARGGQALHRRVMLESPSSGGHRAAGPGPDRTGRAQPFYELSDTLDRAQITLDRLERALDELPLKLGREAQVPGVGRWMEVSP